MREFVVGNVALIIFEHAPFRFATKDTEVVGGRGEAGEDRQVDQRGDELFHNTIKHRLLDFAPHKYEDRKMLTVLFLGDVVGEPGRNAVISRLPELREQHGIDFIVVNGENAAGRRGITGKITIDLLRAGVSVITTGDHVWDQKDIVALIGTEPRLLLPINSPAGAPRSGSIVLDTAKGKVGVINVQARTFMQPILENPFCTMEEAVKKMREETPNILVDVHGETTS